jgi:hypothetical protein
MRKHAHLLALRARDRRRAGRLAFPAAIRQQRRHARAAHHHHRCEHRREPVGHPDRGEVDSRHARVGVGGVSTVLDAQRDRGAHVGSGRKAREHDGVLGADERVLDDALQVHVRLEEHLEAGDHLRCARACVRVRVCACGADCIDARFGG